MDDIDSTLDLSSNPRALLFVATNSNDLLCTAQKCRSCALCEKMWSIENPKNVDCLQLQFKGFISESDFYKDLQQNSKNKICHFFENTECSYQCRENIRNAVKIIVFDGNTEISTVEIDLLLACTDNTGLHFNI